MHRQGEIGHQQRRELQPRFVDDVIALGDRPVLSPAEFACLIAPMFLAMYLRAFYPLRQAGSLIAVLTGACVIAPATPKLTITYGIVAIAIVGAAESFGVVTRALVIAACTGPAD